MNIPWQNEYIPPSDQHILDWGKGDQPIPVHMIDGNGQIVDLPIRVVNLATGECQMALKNGNGDYLFSNKDCSEFLMCVFTLTTPIRIIHGRP